MAKKVDYQALKSELDNIMLELQRENLDVDQALKYYERGLELVKDLEAYLKTAENRVQEVKGTGVVGEEPVLEPGASYEYTSGVPLPTPSGIMMGSYGMVTPAGERFDIDIPPFSLDGPETKRTVN